MNRIVFIFYLVFIGINALSQDSISIFLDKDYKKVSKEKAVLQRTIIFKSNRYKITDQYINGSTINYCEYASVDPWIEDGYAIHYDNNGNVYSSGNYENGNMIGVWNYFTEYKSDDTVNYKFASKYLKVQNEICKTNHLLKTEKCPKKIEEELIEFVQQHINLPARQRNLSKNFKIKADLIIDTTGNIICPEISGSKNSDLVLEALRVLFLYKSNYKIENPLKLSIPIIFKSDEISKLYPIFVIVENNASFQEGDINTFRTYIQEKIKELESNSKIKGRVIVRFVVNSVGQIENVMIVENLSPESDNLVRKVIKESPKWNPASQSGKNVKQMFIIPVTF